MVESFEYNSAKLKVYAKFGKYTFQNRNYFKKFLNDEKIKSNFVVDVKKILIKCFKITLKVL